MRLILMLTGALLLSANSFSQAPNYEDLSLFLADEDYDKLLKKAEKYTLDDDTRKDPVPYYFLAKANYDISIGKAPELSLELDPPKAYKDALKYAAKFVKYDPEGEKMEEYQDFFTDLKNKFVEEIANYILENDWNKVQGILRKGEKVWTNDFGMNYLMGASYLAKQDKSSARTYFETANEHLATLTNFDALGDADKSMIRMGLIQYAKSMKELRSPEKAKDAMNLGYQWFAEDEEYSCMYNDIVNGDVCEN